MAKYNQQDTGFFSTQNNPTAFLYHTHSAPPCNATEEQIQRLITCHDKLKALLKHYKKLPGANVVYRRHIIALEVHIAEDRRQLLRLAPEELGRSCCAMM